MSRSALSYRILLIAALSLGVGCTSNESETPGGDGDGDGDSGDGDSGDGDSGDGDGDSGDGDSGDGDSGDGDSGDGDSGDGDSGDGDSGDGDSGDGDGDSGDGDTSGPPDVVVNPPPKTACENEVSGVTFDVESDPAVWMDGAKAAYSMTHDDQCGAALKGIDEHAVRLYKKWNLVGGPGPFVDACNENQGWDKVREAAEAGLEILNHSYTHVIEDGTVNASNAEREIDEAQEVINEELAKIEKDVGDNGREIMKRADFYIFPYDEFQDSTAMSMLKSSHLGARAGFRDPFNGCPKSLCGASARPPVNTADGVEQRCDANGCGGSGYPEFSDHHITFDVWPRTYSKYALYKAEDILTAYVWDAIDAGGWAMREFHSVTGQDVADLNKLPTDEGFGPIPDELFDEHLGFLAKAWKANLVWTCNPTECIKYRRARQAYSASISGDTISYSGNLDEKFDTPISVIVTTSEDVGSLVATQDGKPVRTRKIGASKFSVTANPALGEVKLEAACEDEDPGEVDEDALPASTRPSPASSVCDIVTVTGTGEDGKMDDLTRNEELGENHYTLPNPSQKDGRDGAWSGYGIKQYGVQEDGGNPYMHAELVDSAWAGVTLAMLGGNGAGACYDASAYCGVSFRIRANAGPGQLGAGEPNANVIVSLITSATQTAAYGGDRTMPLDAGGNFSYAVAATTSWQTKKVIWKGGPALHPPYWCTAPCNLQFEPTKMQAIDWSYSNTQSGSGGRYIDLDDVELLTDCN